MNANTPGDGAVGDEGVVWTAFVGSSPAGSSDVVGPAKGGATAVGVGTDTLATAPSMAGTAVGTSSGTANSSLGETANTVDISGASGVGVLSLQPIGNTPAITLASSGSSLSGVANGVASAVSAASAEMTLSATGGSIASSSAVGVAAGGLSMVSEVVTKSTEDPEFVVAESPELMPLMLSWEADALEAEMKAILMGLFEDNLRSGERFVNALGMPHLGSRELIESALAANGIPIYRGASAASSGAYLLRSWLAHNPKRGLHMLQHMLQMLWPNSATVNQMWQETAKPYPTALKALSEIPAGQEDNYFLTSRVHVSLPARVTTGGDVASIQQGLRASLPARMVLNLAIEEEASFGIGVTSVYYQGCVAQSYVGNFT